MTFARFLLIRGRLLAAITALVFGGTATALAQSEWIVHSFNSSFGVQGDSPMGNLVADSAGNLYGTASEGGTNKWGVVYELVRPVPPQTVWTEIVLHNFTNGTDGAQPVGGLIFDKSGNLYGTASRGTSSKHGVVFELMAPAAAGGKWKEIVLHTFQPLIDDGATPVGELVWDSAGNLYGVTYTGGAGHESACVNPPARGCGSVFQLSPPATAGGAWTETILHSFNYGQGAYPHSGVTLDAHGSLYGTTEVGGAYGDGVVYRLQPPAVEGGAWTYRVLHPFHPMTGSPEGSYPKGALTLHGKGILYGTTAEAGAYGGGTVFQLVPPASAGAAWAENILYSFGAQSGDGGEPAANVIFGTAGNIFGTTSAGIAGNSGTVFELTPPASSGADWTETVLHSFGETGDGATPSSGLIIKNGVLYGVTQDGGTNGEGTVYGVAK
jgi:uncharacterized repeat protein (TIGR03803 family)